MDFKLSEEQGQLRDTLLRFMQKQYGFEKRREIIHSAKGYSDEVWKNFAEMGLLAMSLPEEHGGLGGNAVDTLVVMEAFGRGMVVEPYLSSVVMCAGLIARAGNAKQKADVLPAIAEGRTLLALAHYEAGARYELNNVATRAQKDAGGWRLSGAKTAVLHGGGADKLIVSARSSGGTRDDAGISLFLVDAKSASVSLRSYSAHDGHRMAELTLKDVQVGADALVGSEGRGLALVEHAIDAAIAALCAEAVGNMAALIEATLAYLKTRKQFGVPIGTFQVLQHRMADMVMYAEQARSMAYLAAAKIDTGDAHERRRAIAAAKALIGQAARYVGQQAVQLHGGIGVTDELAVGHYFKRLTLINASFGDADHHLARFSDLILEESGTATQPSLVKARRVG